MNDIKSIELIFSDLATSRIKRNMPDFTGVQKFDSVFDAELSESFVTVLVEPLDKSSDEVVQYSYPTRDIERVKAVINR